MIILKLYQIIIEIVLSCRREVMSKETKHDKFLRLAEQRTNKVLQSISVLGNCSNKSTYEYTEEEVNKLFNAIEKSLKLTKQKFLNNAEAEDKFKF